MATYWKKPPKKPSQSWQILRRERGKATAERHETLDAINLLWQAGKIDFNQAERRVKALVKALQQADKADLADQTLVNRKLLEDYWETEYATRILIDPDSMKNDLERAIREIELLDLATVSRAELQAKVNKLLPANRKKQRRVVARLNQLLRSIGREIRLQAAKKPRSDIKYINEQTLHALLPKLPTKTRLFVGAMFYTGARPGEMFKMFIKGPQVIHIPFQLDRKKVERDTKTGQARDVLVEPRGWSLVEEFIKKRDTIARNARHPKFKEIAKAVIYDLRHSYAIHMLNKGLSISDVALLLGDSVGVCQENYLGFVAKPEGIEAMRRKIEAAAPKPEPKVEDKPQPKKPKRNMRPKKKPSAA